MLYVQMYLEYDYELDVFVRKILEKAGLTITQKVNKRN